MDERSDLRTVLIHALEQYLGLGSNTQVPRTGSEDR
jgi:hypothetical protein